jgi:hypothetical protein
MVNLKKRYTENGVDKLNVPTSFCPDASYSVNHVNYVDRLTVLSNNRTTNSAGFDDTNR